jgi:hypothetical protein
MFRLSRKRSLPGTPRCRSPEPASKSGSPARHLGFRESSALSDAGQAASLSPVGRPLTRSLHRAGLMGQVGLRRRRSYSCQKGVRVVVR